ncbi:hypothetical protein HaLaN_20636 [Haematococcus lacustris]|uniref:Uncharacterized protein n=1 Tax=Haematococcus lacustris TaxID=44745 RepID=A0A699ZLH1_HAELA|nr:hypothetical protein HaLaN_20636 [Haematococcus lacustris]
MEAHGAELPLHGRMPFCRFQCEERSAAWTLFDAFGRPVTAACVLGLSRLVVLAEMRQLVAACVDSDDALRRAGCVGAILSA